MAWIGGVVGALAGPVIGGLMGGSSTSNQDSGAPSYYIPTGLSSADAGWQSAFSQNQGAVNQAYNTVSPLYAQTLAQQQAINYTPYQQAANQAGQQYGQAGQVAQQQGQQLGSMAQTGLGQQQNLYGAANQIYQTAFDPNQAQFKQSEQQLQDQVRAGQAVRGLGNSPVGASEENQAMQNFDLAWRTQQLANQATGLQAMSGASQAGANQGRLSTAQLAAQQAAYGAVPGYTQQSAQVPLQAQQTIAGMPAQNAAAYTTNMGANQQQYSNLMASAIPYMNYGSGATANAYQGYAGNAAVNAANSQAIGNTIGTAVSKSGLGNWLNNTIFGSGTSSPSSTGYDPGMSYPVAADSGFTW